MHVLNIKKVTHNFVYRKQEVRCWDIYSGKYVTSDATLFLLT